ncbi:type IV pilus inner membrane component PilO [Algicola sagamiensis]|uniref:type 4a pilus biogenesis protein PilO n=1 Tax=Algicola sagamiensis TaxID=163869 RepID=UPI00037107DC|nr:type 4a pilus biogenesis protein PilO [Algicola sagamiensis]
MNLKVDTSSIELSELTLENVGSWPIVVKLFAFLLAGVMTLALLFFVLVDDTMTRYDSLVQQEQSLRTDYRNMYAKAANLDLYRQQMKDMEATFATLLKKLPTTHETPGLLDDITYIGTTTGLSFQQINWQPEVEKEFYTELPLKIRVVGQYHDFGEFVSKVAALPRIVSLHDFNIKSQQGDLLLFDVVAKTYRYKEPRGK